MRAVWFSSLDDLDGELQRIEHLRVALLSVESPLSGHHCFTEAIADLDDDMMDNGLSYGCRETQAGVLSPGGIEGEGGGGARDQPRRRWDLCQCR
jgi:hypothetical protein